MLALRLSRALHRVLGSLLCGLFVIWFLSGLVLSFAPFPVVSDRERLARAPRLSREQVWLSLADVSGSSALSGSRDVYDQIELESLGKRAMYRVRRGPSEARIYADTGQRMSELSEPDALALAAHFAQLRPSNFERLHEADQWIPHSEARAQLPALRVSFSDADQTQIYVSLPEARVLQHTTRGSRFWAWCGAIPHWIYPVALRRHASEWRIVVLTLSGLGSLASLAGLIHGLRVARLRRKRRDLNAALGRAERLPLSPFSDRLLRLHHLFGLGFGLVAFTWVLSGMLSLYPWLDAAEPFPGPQAVARFGGGPIEGGKMPEDVGGLLDRCESGLQSPVARVGWRMIAGRVYAVCHASRGAVLATSLEADGKAGARLERAQLSKATAALSPDVHIAREDWLTEPDAYYYPSYFERQPAFPVLRTEFADGTLVYVNPLSGELLRMFGAQARAYRWLYPGLHSWDFPVLNQHGRLRHVLLVLLALGGFVLSVLGLASLLRRPLFRRHIFRLR